MGWRVKGELVLLMTPLLNFSVDKIVGEADLEPPMTLRDELVASRDQINSLKVRLSPLRRAASLHAP